MEKPTYYINGYSAYKNFYLISPDIEFSRFKEIVEGILWERNHPNKPEWLADIQQCIANNFDEEKSVYYTPNWVGDSMELVRTIGKVRILYCPEYDYIEVLGLSEDEIELAIEFEENKCEDGSWISYLTNNKIKEIK